ncbi:MAG TPA: ribonuclease E activity regulator RraA [Ignavibacteria bacterium]|nr:ribonuclease E activity regulator RraA [Ignavibacteria bacterium]
MDIKTADLCDDNSDAVRVADPVGFRDFGGRKNFSGKIQTVKCFENNPLVRKALEQSGEDKVLVIDGGGSKKCALLGDMLGEIASKNKWNGIIVYGSIRDSAALSKIDIGIKALHTNPRKSNKKIEGEENVTVHFANEDFIPGEFVYCDEDGIILSKNKLV